jgi:uracil-DNA glycosylase family 4
VSKVEVLNNDIISCRKCTRLVEYRESVAENKKKAYREWTYWGKPVPAFGDFTGRMLVVGLAPGPHGSNRTGRMFTGDASGVFLFASLYRSGFASQPSSTNRNDGLEIRDMLISAVCRCVPPDNKPSRSEITNCLPYLEREVELMPNLQGFVALGRIAFDNIIRLYRKKQADIPSIDFKHAGLFHLGKQLPWLIASYHPSQQNTQTGRLTIQMFDEIWTIAGSLLV